ncbi:MAG: hypothetical protein RBS80_22830 [Thermoguttaceae bacterium]|jgi:hypothetical protein|nr:hypothetical protein [Thermoguttaceae bacterium]
MLPLYATAKRIPRRGGEVTPAQREPGVVVEQWEAGQYRVLLYDRYPVLCDASNGGPPRTICFSKEILGVLSSGDETLRDRIIGLAIDFEERISAGTNEIFAYRRFFGGFAGKAKEALLTGLKDQRLDPGGVFRQLAVACEQSDDEEIQRLIALLNALALVDIPYDRRLARDVERAYAHDLLAVRLRTCAALEATYDPGVDAANAGRVFRDCLATGRRLVVCRFGRAFYTDALLIANAKGVPSESVRTHIGRLERAFAGLEGVEEVQQVGGEVQAVVNLADREWFSLAEFQGAADRLMTAVRNVETRMAARCDSRQDLRELKSVQALMDRFRSAMYALERRVARAPTFVPAYVSFLSRIHEIDAINIVRVNELLDPFYGENEALRDVIVNTGSNTTISPNPSAWLPFASDWVEALPAYAHYAIIPKGEGYSVVAVTERDILEVIYKTCADDWARNIDDVVAREHAGIARKLVCAHHGCTAQDDRQRIAFLHDRDLAVEAARVACAVEQRARRDFRKIAALQAAGRTRREALAELYGSLDVTQCKPRAGRTEHYARLVVEPERPLPNVNVLTTLGPTETELCIANWLEEAMTLYNIVTAHRLERKVADRRDAYRRRVGNMALKIIAREEMEGELIRVMSERGRKGTSDDRIRAALELAANYPEIGAPVQKMIAEAFGERGAGLRNYTGALAVFTARREVVAEEGLAHLMDDGRYRYTASGPYKRYNLVYTPSRVDLGPEILASVRDVPKWVGGDGYDAARSAKELYSLFNLAGVTAVASPRIAEFLKVGENFFTRGGVYYLSLTAGANIGALGIGDFEFFRGEWNRRGDRTVLPSGETYSGFCVPKEFSLLFAIVTRALNPETVRDIYDTFGIPDDEPTREALTQALLDLLRERRKSGDAYPWEENAARRLNRGRKQYIPRLPQLAQTLQQAGALCLDRETHDSFRITNWKNKKALGLEEINRSGVFDKVRLIQQLVAKAHGDPQAMRRLTGVMAAGYKEDVTDVRFSAGARKLEIYAGLARHLLDDIDPEGRRLYGEIVGAYPAPADVRMVGQCTAKDLFGHVPMDFAPFAAEAEAELRKAGLDRRRIADCAARFGMDLNRWPTRAARANVADTLVFLVFGNNLAQIATAVKQRILACGLTEDAIEANAVSFGADLGRWKGLTPEARAQLAREIGPALHILVMECRGIYPLTQYAAALTGADFLDLGIPDSELLDLVDDLPRLVGLMRNGTPKPLVFADGTSGGRRPCLACRYPGIRDKVKELLALGDDIHYGCMGIGEQTIQDWRDQMAAEREAARDLLAAVLEHRLDDAGRLARAIARTFRDNDRPGAFIQDEIQAKSFGVWKPYYRLATRRISDFVRADAPLPDFGTFLLTGGRWLLSGNMCRKELDDLRHSWAAALGQTLSDDDETIIARVFRESFVPAATEFQQSETGVSGSLKAVEDLAMKLETREIRRQQLRAAQRMARRRAAFRAESERPQQGFQAIHAAALSRVQGRTISEEHFGIFLALVKKAWLELLRTRIPEETQRSELIRELDAIVRGGPLLDQEYAFLAQAGARLFLPAQESADDAAIEEVAQALELLDIALLLEKTIDVEGPEVWRALARYFDATINNHTFDYIPYHYSSSRTPVFKQWARRDVMALAVRRHSCIHQLALRLLRTRAGVRDADALLGVFDRRGSLVTPPVAVNVDDPIEQRWFTFARLRDLTTLIFDGYPLPEVRDNLRLPEGVNVGIVYPIGNTTVSVGLEQGPRLAREGINLFLAPFPRITPDGLLAREIFYRDPKGRWILGRLREEVPVHAVWFHFTHFLRPVIEQCGLPLIQPLLWEAATYLKAELPAMLKGSGVPCPQQITWYGKQTERSGEVRARTSIRNGLLRFSRRHPVLIIKAEKESGGRRALILPARDTAGRVLQENVEQLADAAMDISRTDNAVIQEVILSQVSRLYTPEFLEKVKERFILELGIGIREDTPLFSYFRLVVMKDPKGRCHITHRITVVSTAGVANVGQGGRLFEYRDEKIDPRYRRDLREEMEYAALASLASQEGYLRRHRRRILSGYLESHPDLRDPAIFKPKTNRLGVPDTEILYEMGDYMPCFLADRDDVLQRVYDRENERFIPVETDGWMTAGLQILDARGRLQQPPIALLAGGRRRKLYWQYEDSGPQPVKSLVVLKIEPNPGAGLWRPHNDRLKLVGRDGEGVYRIFQILGEWGRRYKSCVTS